MRFAATRLLLLAAVVVASLALRTPLADARTVDHAAGPLIGTAQVTDGDTVVIEGVRIRLHGIDAPESDQHCAQADGGSWACGLEATRLMRHLTLNRVVTCNPRGLDKYGRVLAVCFAADIDINAEMVRQGLAWAFVRYSADYVAIEQEARDAKRGVFQAETQTPWDLRAARWQTAAADAPNGCAIKGNVNAKGERIYHMPWGTWYVNVRMDGDGKGKRWFCSEDEAMAAGWRPSRAR